MAISPNNLSEPSKALLGFLNKEGARSPFRRASTLILNDYNWCIWSCVINTFTVLGLHQNWYFNLDWMLSACNTSKDPAGAKTGLLLLMKRNSLKDAPSSSLAEKVEQVKKLHSFQRVSLYYPKSSRSLPESVLAQPGNVFTLSLYTQRNEGNWAWLPKAFRPN